MKITFLVYNIYGMGGTVRTVVNTANYFASQNYEVEIISVRRTHEVPLFMIHEKVKITPLYDARRGKQFSEEAPYHRKLMKQLFVKMPSRIIDKGEELYHMFTLQTDFKIISALKGIKEGILITTLPSFNILATIYVDEAVIKIGQEHKYFYGHEESLQRKIKDSYKQLDALTCLTDSEISVYEGFLKEHHVSLYKVENATDLPKQRAELNNKVVIAAGRFVHEKGFDLLIEAFSKVAKKHPEWKLKIFGSGDLEGMLREKIFAEKAYNHVFLMPKTNNVIGEMLKSSIYALSSRNESFGMVIIEAMSVGLPCVSFACTGPREIIIDGEDGVLVEEGNVDELANSLMLLIENEELRKEYGRKAKKNVEKYTFEVIGEKWEKIIEEQVRLKKKKKKDIAG